MNSSYRRRLLQRRNGAAKARPRERCWRRGVLREQLDQVVVRARAADQQAQVADRRPRRRHERAQLAQERGELARRRLGLAATSASRSSSVARRFTNVVLPPAQRVRQHARATARAPRSPTAIAAAVVFALATRPARSSRRAASAVTTFAESSTKLRSSCWSRVSSVTSREVVDSAGLKYFERLVRLAAASRVLRGEALHDVLQALARLRVERVEELVEVDDGRRAVGRDASRRPGARARCSGPGVERDVAVGDARQRGRADDRRRALVQRREVSLSTEILISAWLSFGQLDRRRPSRRDGRRPGRRRP